MSDLNVDEIRNAAGNGKPNFPLGMTNGGLELVRAIRSTNQTGITDSTDVTITYDSLDTNTFSGTPLATGTGIFTVPATGFYIVLAQVTLDGTSGGNVSITQAAITKNGSTMSDAVAKVEHTRGSGNTNNIGQPVIYADQLTASDTIRLIVNLDTATGAAGIAEGSAGQTNLTIIKIG